MNIDKQIKKIQNEDVGNIDSQSFVNNLHRKRIQNDARSAQAISGIISFCIFTIIVFFVFLLKYSQFAVL